ncbi:HTH-type transcriptional regulator DmlR [Pigmentiphaga humi]|uniref:HTH-type transcriptional regulator DmlR n=1 Tax=Pigmentiphaga humi TaxID=2478468 RepID=A0A3P4AZU7_9BURK|nr:LysR family transcriptional regulator [Pigmentiphaga humi]VCU69302.1 HTH-type transcriptional regulator DmlR [Pigmentiphaga humi]
MDAITQLKTFTIVVACGGFSEAARQMNVVPSVVAKRVRQLEATVGARLFDRTTRTVRLTEAGEKLHARAGVLVASFEDLVQSVERDASKLVGHLRVAIPTTLTTVRLGAIFNAFLLEHDRITLDISLVDHSTNPAERDYDLAISGRPASYEGVVEIPLCPVDTLLCATPAYLQRHGRPRHPQALTEHACLVFKPSGTAWHFQSPKGGISVDIPPRLTADDNLTLRNAARMGLGIAALPGYVAQADIASGALVTVLDEFPLQETWFRAYVPRRKQHVARIAAMVDWLTQHLRQDVAVPWERDIDK